MHIDLFRVTEKTRIDVEVTVHFINEEKCPGLKRGGVLNVVRHVVELNCPAGAIPESIEADLSGLDIGDSIHISAIPLPKGVTSTITDRDFTVATLQFARRADAGSRRRRCDPGRAGSHQPEERRRVVIRRDISGAYNQRSRVRLR